MLAVSLYNFSVTMFNVLTVKMMVTSKLFFLINLFATFCLPYTGSGHASIVILTLLCIYYNIILGWSLYYLFMSFTSKLPWSHCDNDWNTDNCLDPYVQYNNNKSACAAEVPPGVTDIPETTTVSAMTTEVTLCINGTLRNASSYTPAVVEFWE